MIQTFAKSCNATLENNITPNKKYMNCLMINQQNDCAPSEDRSAWASSQSDQSSLCAQWVAKDPSFLHADREDSDQTGRMSRLIWVFAGRTCHFVGFVMRRLMCVPGFATLPCFLSILNILLWKLGQYTSWQMAQNWHNLQKSHMKF